MPLSFKADWMSVFGFVFAFPNIVGVNRDEIFVAAV